MTVSLSDRPEQLIRDFLVDNWDPANTNGFDPTNEDPEDPEFLPISTSVTNVGQHYPNVVVSFGNETSAGNTSYNYLTSNGPGQVRDGSVIVTVRSEETSSPSYLGHVDGSGTYGFDYGTNYGGTTTKVDAERINELILQEVERIVLENAHPPPSTDLSYLGSVRTAAAPDDLDSTPPVRIADVSIQYGWLRDRL